MNQRRLDLVGLFDPGRQQRLLAGVAMRHHRCGRDLAALRAKLEAMEKAEAQKLELHRHETLGQCREQRREMLQRWDEAEERLTAVYEAETVAVRQQLRQVTPRFRKQLADQKATIDRKVAARREAVLQQYENRRHQPGQQMRKSHAQIDEALRPIKAELEWTRSLTIGRLDLLPEVARATTPDQDVTLPTPKSVREAVDAIAELTRQAKAINQQLQSGAASKTVDSYYLPVGVAVFIGLWCLVVLLIYPSRTLMWMGLSVPIGALIGFTIYGILLMPLRRVTRQIYPRSERLLAEAIRCAEAGRSVAKAHADEISAELVQRRHEHLAAAKRWQAEQLAAAEKRLLAAQAEAKRALEAKLNQIADRFTEQFNKVGAQMRGDADSLAASISQTIWREQAENRSRRQQLERHRQQELARLEGRLRAGLVRGFQRIEAVQEQLADRFPNWARVASAPPSSHAELPLLPLGDLLIDATLRQAVGLQAKTPAAELAEAATPAGSDEPPAHDSASAAEPIAEEVGRAIPKLMPVVLHRRLHSGLLIEASPLHLDQAIDLAQAVLWRALCGVAPGRLRLTLFDPIGRGQHFSSLMALADHAPELVGHRIWTSERQIAQRLDELAHHAEDILQVNLRDRFERIEQYNEMAGSLAEPYRMIAAIGLPDGLNRDSYRSLHGILDSGLRVGYWTILVVDSSRPWPADMPPLRHQRLLRLEIDAAGRWQHGGAALGQLRLIPSSSPSATIRPELVAKIGAAAQAAARVVVPMEQLMRGYPTSEVANDQRQVEPGAQPPCQLPASAGDSGPGLEIPLGVQGAGRLQLLRVGAGVRQHVLVVGKTGSGKSSLLHTLVTAGAALYRPDQLHFYLLDFKKGVEFKVYAETPLPHGRVIGIESEREFGRSVLQRLDAELQQRGERFRAAGAQQLDDYRAKTGQSLPRVMLVVDEFQELFVRDDQVASQCAMYLDRLVRQGRSFGMHVVLSSQSLAGAHSLPRGTLGQMAIRMALQCSDADAALILADDNMAAKFLSRPGETIYNDAGGLLEGNQPFQAAFLDTTEHRRWLEAIAERDAAATSALPPAVVFEGNRPSRWNAAMAEAAIQAGAGPETLVGLLGEAVEIGPPLGLPLARQTGRNALLVAPPEATVGLIATITSALIASATRHASTLQLVYFDGNAAGQPGLARWFEAAGIDVQTIKPRQAEGRIIELCQIVRQRLAADQTRAAPLLLVIDPLNRFSDLRHDDSFGFSLEAASGPAGPAALQEILRDGPTVGVFTLIGCPSAEILSRWLPRQARHDLQQRILSRVNAADSAALVDSADASDLAPATMLVHDDADGTTTKFRPCDLPLADQVRRWLGNTPVPQPAGDR